MGQGTVLTAPLAPAASFPNSWDQMVSGNECLARRGAGTTAAGGAAGMGAWQRQRRAGNGSASPRHRLLQIRISTMSDKSWTLDVATESIEAVLWPLLHPRRLSGSRPRQGAVLSGGLSV